MKNTYFILFLSFFFHARRRTQYRSRYRSCLRHSFYGNSSDDDVACTKMLTVHVRQDFIIIIYVQIKKRESLTHTNINSCILIKRCRSKIVGLSRSTSRNSNLDKIFIVSEKNVSSSCNNIPPKSRHGDA